MLPSFVALADTNLASAVFDPLTLSPVAWWDASNFAYLWKDAAGTSPVTANGDAVYRVDDRSSNARHLLQATAAKRPAAAAGSVTFDGVDDTLVAAFTLNQPYYRVSVIRTTWSGGSYDFIFDGAAAINTAAFYRTTTSLNARAGTLATLTGWYAAWNTANKHLVVELINGASSSFTLDGANTVTVNPGTSAAAGITVGSQYGGLNPCALTFCECLILPSSISGANLAALSSYLTAKHGL